MKLIGSVAVNDYWWMFSKSFRLTTAIFLLKIANRWATFKIASLEAVATPWFKDPALLCMINLKYLLNCIIVNITSFCIYIFKSGTNIQYILNLDHYNYCIITTYYYWQKMWKITLKIKWTYIAWFIHILDHFVIFSVIIL